VREALAALRLDVLVCECRDFLTRGQILEGRIRREAVYRHSSPFLPPRLNEKLPSEDDFNLHDRYSYSLCIRHEVVENVPLGLFTASDLWLRIAYSSEE
jgi:hypothetical protein